MSVSLKDAVQRVRFRLGELNQFNWSNYQIIADLNDCAREMCHEAQSLTKFQNLVLNQQTINFTNNIPNVSTLVTLPTQSSYFTVTNNSATTTLYFSPSYSGSATPSSQVIAPNNSYTYNNIIVSSFYILGSAASGTYTVSGSNGIQEAALDSELDEVKAVKYFFGQLFPLQFADWKQLQVGASVGSIPLYYYLKVGTRELTPQVTGTSDIENIPIGPQTPLGELYNTVLGVWPIPPEPSNIHVWYSYWHPFMQDPTDFCAIPPNYLWPWSCGAIARAILIEKGAAEAAQYDAMYQKGMADYKAYLSRQKQGDSPARYGMTQNPWVKNPSSAVIVVDPYSGRGAV